MDDMELDTEHGRRERLVLGVGPALRWERHLGRDCEPQSRWATSDVTPDAHARIFDRVELDAGLTLRDVFLLVGDNRVLRAVLHRQGIDDLMAHAAPALARPRQPRRGGGPCGIEFLELFRTLNSHGARNDVEGFSQLALRGVGFLLRQDLLLEGEVLGRHGERVCWDLGFSALDELMDLPLRLAQEVVVLEDKAACDARGREAARFRSGETTLGEVLHGVFRALSFFGTQSHIDEHLECLSLDDDTLDDAVDIKTLLQRIARPAAPRHDGGCPA